MFQALIGPVSSLVGTWLQGKVDKSKADSEVKVARAKAEAKVYETEATSQMLNEKKLTVVNLIESSEDTLKILNQKLV